MHCLSGVGWFVALWIVLLVLVGCLGFGSVVFALLGGLDALDLMFRFCSIVCCLLVCGVLCVLLAVFCVVLQP